MQQYSRGTFFHSAHISLSNPMSFRSVRCWRTMIPGYHYGENDYRCKSLINSKTFSVSQKNYRNNCNLFQKHNVRMKLQLLQMIQILIEWMIMVGWPPCTCPSIRVCGVCGVCCVVLCVLCCVVLCVLCVLCVWRGLTCGKTPFKTPLCAPAKRWHVEHMRAFWRYTRRRLNLHTETIWTYTRRASLSTFLPSLFFSFSFSSPVFSSLFLSLLVSLSFFHFFCLQSALCVSVLNDNDNDCSSSWLSLCTWLWLALSARVRRRWSTPCWANMFASCRNNCLGIPVQASCSLEWSGHVSVLEMGDVFVFGCVWLC